MSATINVRSLIIAEAQRQGVDPGVALAVATRESGISQWRPDGSVVQGAAGELGIFQIMPSTAPGVDLTDITANIHAGVGYLAQMYQQFGTWALAVAAYNDGPRNVQAYLACTRPLPLKTLNYVRFVTSVGLVQSCGIAAGQTIASSTPFNSSVSDPSAPDDGSAAADNSSNDNSAWWLLGGVGLAAAWLMWGD